MQYLKKYYYIIRCKHCDIKRKGEVLYQGIYPVDSFCENCGGDDFYVEKLEKINFFDIKYAIISKEVVEEEKPVQEVFQIWTECDFKEKIAGYLMQKAYEKNEINAEVNVYQKEIDRSIQGVVTIGNENEEQKWQEHGDFFRIMHPSFT